MNEILLDAELRTVKGKRVKALRNQGLLPATVYGKGVEPLSIQVSARSFQQALKQAGRTSLINLEIPGNAMLSVFVHDLQRHPVSRAIIHADLLAVDLKVAVTVDVPVVMVGESPLVLRNEALLNLATPMLHIQALPASLPHSIEVDVSVLDSLEKNFHVSDLPKSSNYTILTDPDQVLITLSSTRRAVESGETAAAPATEE